MSHLRRNIFSSRNITISGEVIADAGANESSVTLTTITLNASGSSSTTGTVNSWEWTQVSGSVVVIDTPYAETSTITAFDVVGSYTFSVRVGDDQGNFDTDSIIITITVPLDLSVTSTTADPDGEGDLIFSDGEPGEVVNLSYELFDSNVPDAITFTGSILNTALDYSRTTAIGTVTLDGNGEATEQYDGSGSGTFTCQVIITGRDIGSYPLSINDRTGILITLP